MFPPAWGGRWKRPGWAAWLPLLVPGLVWAATLRVATFNVEHGIGAAGTAKGDAQRAVLRRVNADLIAFQELNHRTSNEWAQLASELGYPHTAWGEMGPFAGAMVVGFFSRHPIAESAPIELPDDTREVSRAPHRLAVRVPGAAQPLTLWTMHHKALFRGVDDFRRAVEALRIVRDIERTAAAHPDRTEYVVLGDLNDDVARNRDPGRSPQTLVFDAPPAEGLPATFRLGRDIGFPLRYRGFPIEAYRRAGPGFHALEARLEGTRDETTHVHTGYRLDYILVSEALWNHERGPPRAEVYHSGYDRGGGLPKPGEPPGEGASRAASDHDMVFADLVLREAP